MNRKTNSDIRTPQEATAWFADSNTTFAGISEEEVRFLTRFCDGQDVFATDTESVGPLLIQVAFIDTSREVVFSGFIYHGCATVEDLWQLATRLCGGMLMKFQSCALRKAFGSPSSNAPRGHSMKWLAEQWLALKQRAPDLQVAEWSANFHDHFIYRNSLSQAGYNPDDILPPPSSWVSPMLWLRTSQPDLPGYQLGYACCLYSPSSLVFRWHDAVVDALMLVEIISTRQKKLHKGAAAIPAPDDAILRLFAQAPEVGEADYLLLRRWSAREERICCSFLQEHLLDAEFELRLWPSLVAIPVTARTSTQHCSS